MRQMLWIPWPLVPGPSVKVRFPWQTIHNFYTDYRNEDFPFVLTNHHAMNGLNKTEPAICGWIHWGDPRSLAPSRSFPHANACENRRWRAFSMLIWVQEGSGRPRCSVWHSVTSVGGVQTGVEGCPKDLSNLFYFVSPSSAKPAPEIKRLVTYVPSPLLTET